MSFLRRFSNSATGILAGVHCNLSTFRVDGCDFVAHTYSVLYTLYTVFTNRSIEFIYECLDRGLYTFKQIFHINIHAVADCKCCKLLGVLYLLVQRTVSRDFRPHFYEPKTYSNYFFVWLSVAQLREWLMRKNNGQKSFDTVPLSKNIVSDFLVEIMVANFPLFRMAALTIFRRGDSHPSARQSLPSTP